VLEPKLRRGAPATPRHRQVVTANTRTLPESERERAQEEWWTQSSFSTLRCAALMVAFQLVLIHGLSPSTPSQFHSCEVRRDSRHPHDKRACGHDGGVIEEAVRARPRTSPACPDSTLNQPWHVLLKTN
jgi:hypothetical protein